MIGCVLVTASARGADLFDNLAEPIDQNVSMNSNTAGNWLYNAESFFTTANDFVLRSIRIKLALAPSGTETGLLSLEIWSNTLTNQGNQPSVKVADFSTGITTAGLTTDYSTRTFENPGLVLNASTRYWLVLNASDYTGTRQIFSAGTNSASGVGITNAFMLQKDTNAWSRNFGNSHMVAQITAVPEPSAYVTAALAALAIAAAARRKRGVRN